MDVWEYIESDDYYLIYFIYILETIQIILVFLLHNKSENIFYLHKHILCVFYI